MESKIASKIAIITTTTTDFSANEYKKAMSDLSFHTLRKNLTELMVRKL
jgi:hypothetical protein